MYFIEQFKTLVRQETSGERRQRMVPGAIYGLIIASSYALVGCVVNQISFPDLPVGVNWRSLLITWLFFAAWLGLGGGLINWFTQTEEGLVISLLVMTGTALAAGALTFEGDLPTQFGKIILLALPVLAISLLMTVSLRWLGVRHAEAFEKDQALRRRGIVSLTAIAFVIGGVTGFGLTRWTDATLRGVQDIHNRLQTATADPSQAGSLFPLSDMPDFESHIGMPYTLSGHPSGQSVVAIETRTEFDDGYEVACVLLIFPDKPPFLRACAEGEKVSLPGDQ